MPIDKVSSTNNNQPKRHIINAKNTGYMATAGIGLTMVSAMVENKFVKKSHKFFAWFSLATLATHIYLVSKRHKQKQQ